MFCKFCGKQLKDNARFCSGCGKACDEPLRQEPPRQEPPKQEPARRTAAPATTLLDQLQQAHAVFGRTNAYLEEATWLESESVKKRADATSIWRFIMYNIVGAIICSYWASSFLSFIAADIIGDLLGGIAGFAAFIFLSVWFFRTHAKKKKQLLKTSEQMSQKAIQNRSIARDIFEKNYALISFLPVDYWYPMATEHMIKMVQTNRAADLPSALNLFDEQLHRWKLEQINQQILSEQQKQTEYLKEISSNTAWDALGDIASAAFFASKM